MKFIITLMIIVVDFWKFLTIDIDGKSTEENL